jgi:hypothetical protein
MTVVDFAAYRQKREQPHMRERVVDAAFDAIDELLDQTPNEYLGDLADVLIQQAVAIHARSRTETEEVAERILMAVQELANDHR